MAFYANDVHPIPPDHGADDCDDQLPLISRVGRGLAGNNAGVVLKTDDCDTTILEGGHWDSATGEWKSEWTSQNINGGKLMYQYNLRPYTIPRTFTITFMYRRPGHEEHDDEVWSWTTPAIPYIWTLDDAGKPEEFPDHIVGSGVATLFVKTMHTDWDERLHYPEGTTREDFNAPDPEEAWSATITFGHGGDIDVPDFDDIAKIIGITKQDIYNILEGNTININGVDAKDLIDYIDKQDDNHVKEALDHVHKDLGFNNTGHSPNKAFGGYDTVKEYIDHILDKIQPGPGITIVGPDASGNISLYSTGFTNYETIDAKNIICDWKNGWGIYDDDHPGTPITNVPIGIQAAISKNKDGKILAATLKIGNSLDNQKNIADENNFQFLHTRNPAGNNGCPQGMLFSFEFANEYKELNNMKIVGVNTQDTGIWNVSGDWTSWSVKSAVWEKGGEYPVPDNARQFTVCAVSIADGYNQQYSIHGSDLRISPWANFIMEITLAPKNLVS